MSRKARGAIIILAVVALALITIASGELGCGAVAAVIALGSVAWAIRGSKTKQQPSCQSQSPTTVDEYKQVIEERLAQAEEANLPLMQRYTWLQEQLEAAYDANVELEICEYLRSKIDQIELVMVERNNIGTEMEKQGRIDHAILLYEKNVHDEFDGSLPYNRLRIIYTRQKRYAEALRICETYIALLKRLGHPDAGADFNRHRDKLRAKIAPSD